MSCYQTGARGKLHRYGNTLRNRPATTSEKWLSLFARKLAEARGCFRGSTWLAAARFRWTDNAED